MKVKTYEEKEEADLEEQAFMRTLLDLFQQYIKISKKITQETYSSVADIEEPGRLVDTIASHLPLKTSAKQEILECIDTKERLMTLIAMLRQ